MTQTARDLERDIEESRARLDLTIDRLQDKLSVSGILDEMVGSMRANQLASVFDTALDVVRRNPVPVMLVATGIGWLIYRIGADEAARSGPGTVLEQDRVPALDAHSRPDDPEASLGHPIHTTLQSRPDINAQA